MIDKAREFATKAHDGQFRKGTKRPYIVHPIEVGDIVSTMTTDEEVISAAILHDTIEDCEGVTERMLAELFSERVAGMVAQESEDKSRTWMERKSATIEHLRTAPQEVQMIALADKQGCPMDLVKLLPTVLPAGEDAGMLTVEGAKRLDPTGTLQPGIPFCPPEGDAGTGMVATNSVAPRTGNVSAGTSIFAMVVLEKPLSKVYPEIDMVTTPDGAVVAMVHCNNCTSDLNAWVDLLAESAALCGANIDKGALFTLLFNESLHGAPDCGGITPVNYISGESVTHLDAGVPLLLRRPDSAFTLANFMRANIYSAFATLAMGLEILRKENVAVNTLLGHGGIFKTPGVAQRYLAAAAGAPVTCMETAGEGGSYGMALLAAYRLHRADGEALAAYLNRCVFADAQSTTLFPDPAEQSGFAAFLTQYQTALKAERAVVK